MISAFDAMQRERAMAPAIRADLSATELRAWARRASDPRAASRAFAMAHALEGMTRADAARLAGMERQALRDAVMRYNAEGLNGLSDRPRRRRSRLTEGQQAAVRALILRGPDPERDGISAWTRADIARLIEERFGHRYHVSSLDGAGWHTSNDLIVPENLLLLRLPPYSPELNPVERVCLYLRERYLSHRIHEGLSRNPRRRL